MGLSRYFEMDFLYQVENPDLEMDENWVALFHESSIWLCFQTSAVSQNSTGVSRYLQMV